LEEIRDYRFRTLILNGLVAVRWGVAASFTCAVKRYGVVVVADDVGMPLIAPVLGSNDIPGGRDPLDIDHVYGGIPQSACNCVAG
jgi:hypothetical protein